MLINGCCCCNTSLYTNTSCCGFSAKVEFLCCIQQCCCKYDAPNLSCCCDFGVTDMCFHFGAICCQFACKYPSVCCKFQSHMCCVVHSLSIPPDEEVPFVIGLCCFAMYPKTACCKTLGELTGLSDMHMYLPLSPANSVKVMPQRKLKKRDGGANKFDPEEDFDIYDKRARVGKLYFKSDHNKVYNKKVCS